MEKDWWVIWHVLKEQYVHSIYTKKLHISALIISKLLACLAIQLSEMILDRIQITKWSTLVNFEQIWMSKCIEQRSLADRQRISVCPCSHSHKLQWG